MLLEAAPGGTLFLRCFRCGGAFETPLESADRVQRTDALAPEGFVLPGPERVREAIDRGWGATVMVSLDPDWKARLGSRLRDAGSRESGR